MKLPKVTIPKTSMPKIKKAPMPKVNVGAPKRVMPAIRPMGVRPTSPGRPLGVPGMPGPIVAPISKPLRTPKI